MQRIARTILLSLFAALLLPAAAWSETVFPDFLIEADMPEGHAQYLGVPEGEPFHLSDIQGDSLFIVIFSLYCAPCQREAPALNEMYREIEARGLADSVKFIGLAMGNTVREMEFWRDKFDVPFPLVSDEDYTLHRRLGNIGTPTHVLTRLDGSTNLHVIFSKTGAVEETDEYLSAILANTDADVEEY